MISSIRLLALAIILLSHSACKNPYGEQGSAALKFGANNTPSTDSPNTDTPSSVTVTVDQIDDDNSSTGFGGGTHRGTAFVDDELTLDATTNYAELDESWTPKWDNLISYWKMDGDFQDSVGTNHGAPQGNATTTTTSKVGSHAGLFDGAADYTQTPNINLGSNFSISFWIRPDNLHNYGDPVSAGTTDGHLTFVTYADGHMFYAIGNGSWANSVQLPPGYLENGKWYYIVGTYDGSDIKLYANGSFIGSAPVAGVSINQVISIGERISEGYEYEGKVDDLAIWNTALTTNEVSLIYSRQSAKYAGEMKSRVIDSKDINSSWTNLDWIPTLPFGKELPDGGGVINSESSTAYPSLESNTLMDGVVGLWHLNEGSAGSAPGGSDFEDSSGVGNHATVTSGSISYGQSGKLKKSYSNNASGQVAFGSALIPTGNSPRTTSVWYKTLNTSDRTILAYGAHNNSQLFELVNYNSNFIFHGYGGGFDTIAIPAPTKYGAWNHGLISYDGAVIRVYLNGELKGQKALALNTGSAYFQFGHGYFTFWDGSIDEVAIWNRTLSDKEVLQLYRRGANRIKYQVRTCANSDCSDQNSLAGNGWQGPGGNYLTYFSELYNNSYVTSNCSIPQECFASELSQDGDVKVDSPSIYFNQFGADGVSVDNSRYFQYRVIMESDDENAACENGISTCMPELNSVEIGPSHTYEQ